MFTTRIPALASMASEAQVDIEFVSPVTSIKIEPQDEGSILMDLHQEGERDQQDHYAHDQPPAHPQPEPRRSARIKAMNKRQDAVPPKVKPSAKSTGRKRAARKK